MPDAVHADRDSPVARHLGGAAVLALIAPPVPAAADTGGQCDANHGCVNLPGAQGDHFCQPFNGFGLYEQAVPAPGLMALLGGRAVPPGPGDAR